MCTLKRLVLFLQLILITVTENAQTNNTWTKGNATQWCNSRAWASTMKLQVYKDVNTIDFANQYHKNKTAWDKAFAYLSNHKLDTISAGKYYLMGDTVFVTVSDNKPKTFEETKWEAHKKYIDIQYVAKGKEKMGVASFSKATEIEPYNDKKDVGFYSMPESECKYYVAQPDTFLIFFPSEAHRPNIRIDGIDADKKIVIKIKVE
jgi:YhcH/YjgK/YiaL family protein